jgi:uncharacterized protein (TIGR02145 family)
MLYAVYYDGMKYVSVPKRITIQDCQCCWAYLTINGNPEWRAFMCHNLGATESANPFMPSYRINGAYYQWGSAIAAASAPGSANPGDGGSISGWNSTLLTTYYGKDTNGDDNATVKSGSDPCPAGYRVPSQNEWTGLYNYYTTGGIDKTDLVSPSGTWQSGVTYFSGKNFGGSLFLPAAGLRNDSSGTLYYRGYNGYYWSTLRNPNNFAGSLIFGSTTTGMNTDGYRIRGYSVRCIAE